MTLWFDCRNLQIIIVFLAIVLAVPLFAQEGDVFRIGSVTANRGEKASGKLVIGEGIDKGTFVPISIIQGAKPGPVLTLNAGIHCTEYVPIIVLQKLLKEIEPEKLSGTVVLVHIANIPAFKGFAVYNNPVDQKNLNRVYPGKEDGTLSERIAYAITNEIIVISDYYIDLHGGEFNEQLVDYIYFMPDSPNQELNEASRMLAHATGNHYIIPDKYLSTEETKEGIYSDVATDQLGIPAVSPEWGDKGKVDKEVVDIAMKGMKNVLRTLGMMEGKPFINEHPVYLVDDHEVMCNFNGILYTEVDKAQFVSKGSRMGDTTDYWGNILEEYYAPITGMVVLVRDVPAINEGETVFRVSKVAEELK